MRTHQSGIIVMKLEDEMRRAAHIEETDSGKDIHVDAIGRKAPYEEEDSG